MNKTIAIIASVAALAGSANAQFNVITGLNLNGLTDSDLTDQDIPFNNSLYTLNVFSNSDDNDPTGGLAINTTGWDAPQEDTGVAGSFSTNNLANVFFKNEAGIAPDNANLVFTSFPGDPNGSIQANLGLNTGAGLSFEAPQNAGFDWEGGCFSITIGEDWIGGTAVAFQANAVSALNGQTDGTINVGWVDVSDDLGTQTLTELVNADGLRGTQSFDTATLTNGFVGAEFGVPFSAGDLIVVDMNDLTAGMSFDNFVLGGSNVPEANFAGALISAFGLGFLLLRRRA